MTEAEKLMKDRLSITLNSNKDGAFEAKYVAKFNPDEVNPFEIISDDYVIDDPMKGDAIYLSYESAVELAKFLKRLFIDNASE